MPTRSYPKSRLVRNIFAMLALFALACSNPVGAAVLTFDTFPDGSAATDDGAVGLADVYTVGGVSFTIGFDSDDDNVADTLGYLEAAGDDARNAFLNDALGVAGLRDTADPGFEAQLGAFLYRTQDTGLISATADLVIQFDAATRPAQVSGEIWDIDTGGPGTEQWLVEAFNASGTQIQALQSPLGIAPAQPASLDGRPWLWTMGPGALIDRIEISFIGSKTDRIGLAFDNFTISSSAQMPEPGSFAVFFGLGAIGLLRHRPQRQRGA